MTTAADLHTLTGAYAAHALGDTERQAFERHLAQCPACTQEVREFTATLARLGSAEAVVPPAELRARVMAGIGTVRQLAPASSTGDGPDGPGARTGGRLGHRLYRLALAASVAAAASLGVLAYQQHDQAEQARARTAALAQQQAAFGSLLTAPDARTSTATAGSGVGTVVWSQSRGQAGFLASGLPKLPADRTYQLWYNDAGTMRPAGLLPASTGTVLLTGPIGGAAGVGVTVEPAGGSPHPTAAPTMLLAFT
ncbi:anti-sigma factor [Kitasatospora sp. NPDC048540]|uniref:anti-sigma factor n=1 Tax=unclassified Kitasatospora TaxID=2633591 RepID=UPI00053A2CE9|nr:anti-sigma factor [Kitasatospora sp. MBT63]